MTQIGQMNADLLSPNLCHLSPLLILISQCFKRFDLCLIRQQVVDVIETVYQTVFFVGVDVEVLALARGLVGDGLGGQVDFDFCCRIGIDRVEKLGQERFAYDNRKDEVIQLVVFVDVGKEAADNHTESVFGNRPS